MAWVIIPCIPVESHETTCASRLLVAAVCMPASVSAGELVLSFKDGRVTLKATDVTLRQVLNEWARLGQTRIVGLEKLGGGLLTLELDQRARETGARDPAASGRRLYRRAARQRGADASVAANVALRPARAAADEHRLGGAHGGPPGPRRSRRRRPTPFPDPTQLANEEPDADDGPESAGRAGLQSQRRAGEHAGDAGRPGRADARPASRAGAPTIRMPPAPVNGPAPVGDGTARHCPSRRDPRAADATAPVSAGSVYSPST